MKKLLCISVLFMGGLTAFAQTPLDGFSAPSFAQEGNCGNLMSVVSTGGTVNVNIGPFDLDSKEDRGECGYVEGHDIVAAPGSTVEFDVKISTVWGKFAMFAGTNNDDMNRIMLCGNASGWPNQENNFNDKTLYIEDGLGSKLESGTLPSVAIPADAIDGSVYLVRMMFFGPNDGDTDASAWDFDYSYKEGTYYDFKITVRDGIEAPKYTVTFPQSVEHGSFVIKDEGVAITSGDEIEQGTRLTVEIAPDAGYYIDQIIVNGSPIEGNSFVVSGDMEVSVSFVRFSYSNFNTPSFAQEGNCGNLMSVVSTGGTVNVNIGPFGLDSKEDRGECGYVEGHDIVAAPGSTVEFDVKISTVWGKFAMFIGTNNDDMNRIMLCGNASGWPNQENNFNDKTLYIEDGLGSKLESGTLPSVIIPTNATNGDIFLVRMIFFGANSSETESDWTYNHTYAEGQYYDFIVKVDSTNGISEIAEGSAPLYYAHNEIFAVAEGEIEIYNLTGSLVKRAYAASVAVDELPAGVYVARANGKTLKFVK